jgi:hypothetical protein
MKKSIFLTTIAALIMCSVLSCKKEQKPSTEKPDTPPEEIVEVFSAVFESYGETKTYIGAAEAGQYNPRWEAADKICINGVASSGAPTLTNDNKNASFSFGETVHAVGGKFYAVNPSQATWDATSKKFTVALSGTAAPQVYNESTGGYITYDASSAFAAACSSDKNLSFKSLMAFFKLTINGSSTTGNITSIYLRQDGDQENIAGDWAISFGADGKATMAPVTLSDVIAYNCVNSAVSPSGLALGSEVLIAVPAYNFSNGLILTVKDADGLYQSYSIPPASSDLSGKQSTIIKKTLTFDPQSGSINSAADWETFAAAVNSGNDADLYRWVGNGTVQIGSNFTIDNPTQVTGGDSFKYNVEGNNKTITITNGQNSLFRSISTSVKNLTIAGSISPANGNVCAFADSLLAGGSITSCTNAANITSERAGATQGGGIVCIMAGGTISDCHNKGAISVAPDCAAAFRNCYIGGLVGQIAPSEAVLIKNSTNSGAITVAPTVSSTSYNFACVGVGGIVGWVKNTAFSVALTNCDNLADGDITFSAENFSVLGARSAVSVGGIIGMGAPYSVSYRMLSTPGDANGFDITLTDCDNSGSIYNCGISNATSYQTHSKAYSGGIAGSLLGTSAAYIKVKNCNVYEDCSIIPYDIVGGSDQAAFSGITGGMIGFGGFVDIDGCVVKPYQVGNGKRQSMAFSAVIGFAMKPFILQNSKVWISGYFNRDVRIEGNRAVVAVVPTNYGSTAVSPKGDVTGSEVKNCQIGGKLMTSTSCYPNTNIGNLSSNCTVAIFNTLDKVLDNIACGHGYTANNGVTITNVTSWDGVL